MRLRVETEKPLPKLKFWYCPGVNDSQQTILTLKKAICQQILPLRNAGAIGDQLSLLLDGFELLDDSLLNVLRDDDHICIRRRLGPSSSLSEKNMESPVELDSPSTSSMSSTPSLSSSQDFRSSSMHNPKLYNELISTLPSKPFVPPGQGKIQTHQRNLRRRRRKRLNSNQKNDHEMTPVLPSHLSTANSIPVGFSRTKDMLRRQHSVASNSNNGGSFVCTTKEGVATIDQGIMEEILEIPMASLKNKNKKRDQKKVMSRRIPAKIVFDDNGKPMVAPSIWKSTQASEQEEPNYVSTVDHHLCSPPAAPSEKQVRGELPSRMFVSSVDVETRSSDKNQKRYLKDMIANNTTGTGNSDDESYASPLATFSFDNATPNFFDWDRVEKDWENFVPVSEVQQLAVGTLVGWMALDLNPRTLTPEKLLFVAHITSLPDNHISRSFVARKLSRLDASDLFMSFGLHDFQHDEEFTWDEITASKWRIIK